MYEKNARSCLKDDERNDEERKYFGRQKRDVEMDENGI